MGDTILNLGCGQKKLPNAVNLDVTPDTNPDVVHNLNVCPWPFSDNQFSEVRANDVIEHLGDIVEVMGELHRVCRQGAKISITVPHFSSANAFTDPTHRHYFGWYSFDYFTGEHEHSYYTRARFRMANRQMVFHDNPTNKLVRRLAGRWPAGYERAWAWTFPAWFMWYELEVVKEERNP